VERENHEKTKATLVAMQEQLKARLGAIETGCGKELFLRLKTIRDQVFTMSQTSMIVRKD
jgi:hypothetical protein